MRRNIPVCLSRAHWLDRDPSVCATDRDEALDPTIETSERAAINSTENATYIDLSSSFCDERICRAEVDGAPIFRDSHHITADFSRTLAGPLQAALKAL
ncbi:SGNH hydrolase domain-containing protein [Rhizobium phaseoli]|uniref:SGNH hydrolase domain-containing protein n=1 Tax=Rhizobium phaseoli TaxID=396 RepID=UPI003CC99391